MTRQNSTLTLSKLNTATSVSTLDHSSSPQNDSSLSVPQMGFIQLIESGSVIAQRQGSNDETTFEYLKANVWDVRDGLVMQFVTQTNYVHPMKFFRALPKTSVVKVYHNQLTDTEPMDVKPVWEGLAAQIENSNALIESEQWDAFDVQGNWIGTSEY